VLDYGREKPNCSGNERMTGNTAAMNTKSG
jgi:hypothetical protein